MTIVDFLETIVRRVQMIGADAVLNMSIVYQDSPTRRSAFQVWDCVTQIVGEEYVRSSWWEMEDLTHPLLLRRAVQDAVEADVIVIAVRAGNELPLDLYAWIDTWLPRRLWRPGGLVVAADVNTPSRIRSLHAQEYLGAVASRGQLDFQIVEWKSPLDPMESGCRRHLPKRAAPRWADSAQRCRSNPGQP